VSKNVVEGSSTVDEFIASGECYSCLCVTVTAILTFFIALLSQMFCAALGLYNPSW
jgi:hypothetical protein